MKWFYSRSILFLGFIFSFSTIALSGDYSGGTGVPEDPYKISTPTDFNSIGLDTADYSAHFVLTADIDMSAVESVHYNMIGNADDPFTGTFDGGGHAISHFSWDSTGQNDIGLFGWIGADGQISDLRVTDVTVETNDGDCVGIVAGQNEGLIQRCSIDGSISGRYHIGGIAGINTGTIQDSCASGDMTGTNNIGGLAGSNSGTLKNSYSTATVPIVIELPPKIYWVDYGTDVIQRANLNGTDVEDLLATGPYPYGIAIDPAGSKMYWTDITSNTIQCANLDGSFVEDLITTGLSDPKGIAIDDAAGKMYWTDSGTDKIQRANLDGSSVEDLVTTGLSDPSGIALDIAGGKMYWIDGGNDTIKRANLNGSSVQNLITTGLDEPKGIALDITNGKMYWTATGNDKIQRANLNGTSIQDIVITGLSYPTGITLDDASGKLYWTDLNTNKIQRCNRDGSDLEDVIATGLNNPAGIAFVLDANITNHSGGVVGFDDGGVCYSCFWDTEASGTTTSACGEGRTTAEMKTVNPFFNAGWDFMNTWIIADGVTYPILRKYSAVDTNFDGKVDILDLGNFAGQWLNGCILDSPPK